MIYKQNEDSPKRLLPVKVFEDEQGASNVLICNQGKITEDEPID